MSAPHIAIIGAGITGTTLALALLRRNLPFTLYEQSSRPTELGAGLGIGPNAARAFKLIDVALWREFLRVGTARDFVYGGTEEQGVDNDQSKRAASSEHGDLRDVAGTEKGQGPVWIHFLDGTRDDGGEGFRVAFPAGGDGQGAVHRALWLGVLMGMVGEERVRFGKRLVGVEEGEEGKVVVRFGDGSCEEVDAVVGCDGVKSVVRGFVSGGGECGYSGKYAYRCMIPMDKAVEAIGRERTEVSSLWVSFSAIPHQWPA